jgi:hypothetical protein
MSFLTVLNWTLGFVATFGVAGLVVLAFTVPTAEQLAARGLTAFLRRMLATRIGVAVLVGILCLIVGELAGDWHGRTACRAEQARADAEAKTRDQDQAELATYDAMQRSDALKAAAAKDQETQHALAKADATCHPITARQLR